MNRISSEKKITYLSGDFNINLLNTETDNEILRFYEIMTSNLFVPHITLPTRITTRSQTLIDNIFSNNPEFSKGLSGNFTFSISDHLAQFLIIPACEKKYPKKHNLYKRDLSKLKREEFVADTISVNWNETLETWHGDINHSFSKFNDKVNEILDKHAPLKKLKKKRSKTRSQAMDYKGCP